MGGGFSCGVAKISPNESKLDDCLNSKEKKYSSNEDEKVQQDNSLLFHKSNNNDDDDKQNNLTFKCSKDEEDDDEKMSKPVFLKKSDRKFSHSNLHSSQANLFASQSNLFASQSNLFASQSNLMSSQSNLFASFKRQNSKSVLERIDSKNNLKSLGSINEKEPSTKTNLDSTPSLPSPGKGIKFYNENKLLKLDEESSTAADMKSSSFFDLDDDEGDFTNHDLDDVKMNSKVASPKDLTSSKKFQFNLDLERVEILAQREREIEELNNKLIESQKEQTDEEEDDGEIDENDFNARDEEEFLRQHLSQVENEEQEKSENDQDENQEYEDKDYLNPLQYFNMESESAKRNAELFSQTALSLEMDNEDLLFNMMYFAAQENKLDELSSNHIEENDNSSSSDQKKDRGINYFNSMLNTLQEETIALHNENNLPYKLNPLKDENQTHIKYISFEELFCSSFYNEPTCSICCVELSKNPEDENLDQNEKIHYEDYNIKNLCYLQCHHYFHSNCLTKWLKYQSFCPICKVEV